MCTDAARVPGPARGRRAPRSRRGGRRGAAAAHHRPDAATAVFVATPKVARWLERYPRATRTETARYLPGPRVWQVRVYSGEAGEIARGRVSISGEVVQAWVGPEVVWPLALGNGLGGVLNDPLVWLSMCLVFFLGLANLRRPLSLRNLDLLVFLSFSVYLLFFNQGRVFASALAAALPFAYLIARCAWIGGTNRVSAPSPMCRCGFCSPRPSCSWASGWG